EDREIANQKAGSGGNPTRAPRWQGLAEAKNKRVVAMQALAIRIARGLNLVMRRRGQVFADRYHVNSLENPTKVRNALLYVLKNHEKHAAQVGRTVEPGRADRF